MRPRTDRALLGHLRELRPRLSLSQQRLAEVSQAYQAPVSREFIASLETAGLPGTVRKFLTFAWLTGADVNLLTELSVVGAAEVPKGLSAEEVIDRVRTAAEAGKEREGLAIALEAARTVRAAGRGADEARLLVAGSIAAKGGGYWRLGRELAERALCHPEVSDANKARAALIMAQCLSALDRDELALRALGMIDDELLERDAPLRGAYWHDRCIVLHAAGRTAEALESARAALEVYQSALQDKGGEAKLRSVRALLLCDTGDRLAARAEAARAVEIVRATGTTGTAARRTHVNAGAVFLGLGEAASALEHLTRARDLAEASGHELDLFEARLYLYELAEQQGRGDQARMLRRALLMDAPRFQLDRLLRREYERIVGGESHGRGRAEA